LILHAFPIVNIIFSIGIGTAAADSISGHRAPTRYRSNPT